MRNPHLWNRMLTISLVLITSLYLLVGVGGYAVYAEKTLSPILLNLPHGINFLTLHFD